MHPFLCPPCYLNSLELWIVGCLSYTSFLISTYKWVCCTQSQYIQRPSRDHIRCKSEEFFFFFFSILACWDQQSYTKGRWQWPQSAWTSPRPCSWAAVEAVSGLAWPSTACTRPPPCCWACWRLTVLYSWLFFRSCLFSFRKLKLGPERRRHPVTASA